MELIGMKGALTILIHANKSMCKAFGRTRNWPSSFYCFILKYVIYIRLRESSHTWSYTNILISVKTLSWQVGVLNVCYFSPGRILTCTEIKIEMKPTSKRALKPFGNKEISFTRETIVFFTIQHLIIFPKQLSFQLIESVEHTVNLLLLLVLLTNGYQPHWKEII